MNIKLSPKHGVNPTIPRCFFCGEPKNEIVLLGRLLNDEEAPKNAVFDKEPCDKCKEWMKQGVMLISVRDGELGDNPYRTGKICVVKDEAIEKWGPPEFAAEVLEKRMAFVPDEVWKMVGLPEGESNEPTTT